MTEKNTDFLSPEVAIKAEFEKVVDNMSKSLKSNQHLEVKEPVVNKFGEVVFDGKITIVTEVFTDIPYRTPRDLKGYDDTIVSTEPSQLDLTNYADNRDVIAQLVRNLPQSALVSIANAQSEEGDYTSDNHELNEEYQEFSDDTEPLDNLTQLAQQAELNNSAGNVETTSEDKPKQGEAERSDNEPSAGETEQGA